MILSTLQYLMNRLRAKRDPVAYARSIGVTIGEGTQIFSHEIAIFGGEPFLVTLGNNNFITYGVRFITHDGGVLLFRDKYPDIDIVSPIVLGSNVYVGAYSLILPGTVIGNNVIVGAGSVVRGAIPDDCVCAGCPVRVIKTIKEYENNLLVKSIHTGQMSQKEKTAYLKKHFMKE